LAGNLNLPSSGDDIFSKVKLRAVPLEEDELGDLVQGGRDGVDHLGGHVLRLQPGPKGNLQPML